MKTTIVLFCSFLLFLVSCSTPQKANHNSVRSNKSTLKGDGGNTTDTLLQKANHNSVRSNKNTVKGDGGNTKDTLQQKSGVNNPYFAHSDNQGDIEPGSVNKGKIIIVKDTHKSPLRLSGNSGNNGHVAAGREQQPTFYTGGGFSSVSRTTKDGTNLSGTSVASIGYYQPLLSKPGISTGFVVNVALNLRNAATVSTVPAPFKIEGQVSSIVDLFQNTGFTQAAYAVEAGPQINFYLGSKWIVSPVLQAGYMKVQQQGFEIMQVTNNGREDYSFVLLKQNDRKLNLFILKPAVKAGYQFNKRIGIYTEANYNSSSTINTATYILLPEGNANPAGQYTISQMQRATANESIKRTRLNSFGINIGVSLTLAAVDHKRFKAGADLSDKVN